MKSYLNGGVTNVSDMSSAQGAVLAEFVSHILRCEVINRLRCKELIGSVHVPKWWRDEQT